MASGKRRSRAADPALAAVAEGWNTAAVHPLVSALRAELRRTAVHVDQALPVGTWARLDVRTEEIRVRPRKSASADEWTWVFTHLLLHLGLGHDGDSFTDPAATAAAETTVGRLQQSIRLGRNPGTTPAAWPVGSEEGLTRLWRARGVPDELIGLGPAAACIIGRFTAERAEKLQNAFAVGLSEAVLAAVEDAGGGATGSGGPVRKQPWERAREWFISAFPLLGATMSVLTLVADAPFCRSADIAIAAVDPVAGELYVNPHAGLSEQEWRFVLGHEALHAALAHHARAGGRDHYLFNLATDFVINGWLLELGVGEAPEGMLYDPRFDDLSSEEVYDIIATEARRYRKLATLRGRGSPDILADGVPLATPGASVDLDELLRRSLAGGLDLHYSQGRGIVPAGLVVAIRSLSQPAPRWDVELARWFEEWFPAVDAFASYARPSRRQSATPDIPRPGWQTPEVEVTQRTFGVVLDTSLSMGHTLLGNALGAIASYAAAHDVDAVRVVYCDAVAYDAGYVAADDIADGLRVRGRGGTVLQPGVDRLERAPDFPADGPILIITDGYCDVVRVQREHAYLIPKGASLPFRPKGPVFRFE
jgi:predicted metal-dependent peptidase